MPVVLDTRLVDNPKVLKYLLPISNFEKVRAISDTVYLNTLDCNRQGVALCEQRYLEKKDAVLNIHKSNAFVLIRTRAILNGLDVKVQLLDGMRDGTQLMQNLWTFIGHRPCLITKRKKTGIICVDYVDDKANICHIVVRSFDVDAKVKKEKKKGKLSNRPYEIRQLCDKYSRHLNDVEGVSMLTSVYTKAEL